MGNFKKRIALLAAAAVMTSTVLAGCGNKVDPKATVLTVGEDQVTMEVANFYARHQQAIAQQQYAAMFGEDFWGKSFAAGGNTMEQDVKAAIIEQLKELYVLEDHMADYNVSISEDEKAKIAEAAKAFVKANDEKTLEKVSGTEETVNRVLELMTIQRKMQNEMIKDVDTNISDEDAKQKSMDYVYFSATKNEKDGKTVDMSKEEKAELKKKAEGFAEKAKTTEDFKALAKEYELTESTMTFDSKKTVPSEEFIKAADQLKEGEVTGVIEAGSGFYVGKVTSLFDKAATEAKKQEIVNERQNAKYQELVDKFMKDVKFKVNEEEWEKVSFTKVNVSMKQEKQEQKEK